MDETRRILDMVAEGTITTEQAADLLDALSDGEKPRRIETATRTAVEDKETRPDVKQIVEAAMFGVTPEYRREMEELLGEELELGQLVEMKMFNVDRAFVASMREAGMHDLSAHDLGQLKMAGATADLIRDLRAKGIVTPATER